MSGVAESYLEGIPPRYAMPVLGGFTALSSGLLVKDYRDVKVYELTVNASKQKERKI